MLRSRANAGQRRGGLRPLRGAGEGPLRELPRGPVRAPHEAPPRLCPLRLCPDRRRFRRRADLRGRAPGEAGPVGGAPGRRLSRRGGGAGLRGPRGDGPPAGHPEGAAPRPPLGLSPGHGQEPLRELGGAARLLPPLGQPGGAAGAAGLRPGRPRASSALRRHLHRAPARQPLAGCRRRLLPGPDLRSRGPDEAARRRHLGLQHRAGERRLPRPDGRPHRPHPGAVRGGPAPVRPGGTRAPLRDASHLARRDVGPRPDRGGGRRRVQAPPDPLRPRQGGPGLAGLALVALDDREPQRAPHPQEPEQLLLRLPDPSRGEAAGHLRPLLLLPGGGRLRGRGGRRRRAPVSTPGWTRSTGATATGRPRPSWAASWRRPWTAFRSRAPPSRTSWPAAAWT